jgi:hypothetical protein
MSPEIATDEVARALAECANERRKGALPLAFSAEAHDMAQTRYREAFEDRLAEVGGWEVAGKALRRAAFFFGVMAREIAAFHNASEISLDHAIRARRIMENECDIKATKVKNKEGFVCNGLQP